MQLPSQICTLRNLQTALPHRLERNRIACKSQPEDKAESRLEQLEDAARKGKKQSPSNMSAQQSGSQESYERVVWNEGSLFPEGWEKMDPLQKAGQLYMGERGLLFWMNKLAYGALFVMGGAWVLFRFVGPSLGLYELANSVNGP